MRTQAIYELKPFAADSHTFMMDGFEVLRQDGQEYRTEVIDNQRRLYDRRGRCVYKLSLEGCWVQVSSPIHEQALVSHPRSGEIEVDAGIANILKKLWALGYTTFNSCECNFGKIWIEFSMSSYQKWMGEAFIMLCWGGDAHDVRLWTTLQSAEAIVSVGDYHDSLTVNDSMRVPVEKKKDLENVVSRLHRRNVLERSPSYSGQYTPEKIYTMKRGEACS